MTLADVAAVAAGARVTLHEDVVDGMRGSRQVVDDAVARGDLVYGVTTGVGHARDQALPAEALASMQPMLLEMNVGATGEPLPPARVRAAMVVRLNGFARGGAGVSPGVARALADLLDHGIHPVILSSGSVGSGDLGQLASVGLALLGRGTVDVDGRAVDAGTALEDAGLEPVSLEPKDGLALMSSNAVAVGHGALLVGDVERVVGLADLVVATSMETFGANPSIVEPAVARAGAGRGMETTAGAIRSALRGGEPPTDGMSVQDPLSFRVVPQVHGACRDTVDLLADAVLAELNAPSDNPLVDLPSQRIISNGNFQPMNLALAAESMRVALCHVGLLAERRMGHLWDAAVSSFGPDASGTPGPPNGGGAPPVLAGLALRYPAAAAYTRLRHLANPVTLDVPSLDLAVEDHATNLAEALDRTSEATAILHDLLVVELLIAVAGRGPGPPPRQPGRGTGRLVGLVVQELQDIPIGTSPQDVHRRTSDLLHQHADALLAPDDHADALLAPDDDAGPP
nr:aromatic amino acid ammonia-lyase [Salsipaludibacter albus]